MCVHTAIPIHSTILLWLLDIHPTALCPTKLLFYCFRNNGLETPYSLRVLLVRSRNRSFLSNLLNMLSAGNKNTPLKFHCSSLYFIFANAAVDRKSPFSTDGGPRATQQISYSITLSAELN